MIVRLDGAVENALESLVELGYFKTRSEAVRAGILTLAKEYGVVGRQPSPKGEASAGHSHIALHEMAKRFGTIAAKTKK